MVGPPQVKMLARQPEFDPQNSHKGRRIEPAPQSCPDLHMLAQQGPPPNHTHGANKTLLKKFNGLSKFRLGCLHNCPGLGAHGFELSMPQSAV